MRMPEEINRIVADRLSTLLFCPTDTAVANLAKEGVSAGVENVGDVMFDVALFYRERARKQSTALASWGLPNGHSRWRLATGRKIPMTRIALGRSSLPWLKYPRACPSFSRSTRVPANCLLIRGLDKKLGSVKVVDPVPFLDMVALEQAARVYPDRLRRCAEGSLLLWRSMHHHAG